MPLTLGKSWKLALVLPHDSDAASLLRSAIATRAEARLLIEEWNRTVAFSDATKMPPRLPAKVLAAHLAVGDAFQAFRHHGDRGVLIYSWSRPR